MRRIIFILAITAGLYGPAVALAEGIAVIVNKGNKISDLSGLDLAKMYSGKMGEWPDGRSVVVINRDSRSEVRRDFYKRVLKAKPTQRYFVPGSSMPFRTIVQKSTVGMIRFVASDPNSIGYVYIGELKGKDQGVKILKVVE